MKFYTADAVRDFIRLEGGKVITITSGRHWRVRANFGGNSVLLTMPRTPSDWRAIENIRTAIRKEIKRGIAL